MSVDSWHRNSGCGYALAPECRCGFGRLSRAVQSTCRHRDALSYSSYFYCNDSIMRTCTRRHSCGRYSIKLLASWFIDTALLYVGRLITMAPMMLQITAVSRTKLFLQFVKYSKRRIENLHSLREESESCAMQATATIFAVGPTVLPVQY